MIIYLFHQQFLALLCPMCVSGHLLLQLPEQGCEGEFCGFPTAVHSDARETQNSSALPGGHLGLPPQTALFPWDLIWAVPLVYSPNQKDLEEEIKAFPATTVLGLGYNGASLLNACRVCVVLLRMT